MHGLFGPKPVTGNAKLIGRPTYHLMVADFSNVFISDQAILGPNASSPRPVTLCVLGLPASVDAGE